MPRMATIVSIEAELRRRAFRREIAPYIELRRRLRDAYDLDALLVLGDEFVSPACAMPAMAKAMYLETERHLERICRAHGVFYIRPRVPTSSV
jgi:hypothetical protein